MTDTVTLAALRQMKREGRKIVAVVAYDYQMAQIVDRAGVDLVSVGDSVGVNLWGHQTQREVSLDHMVLVCRAVRRGVSRALVSCDMPFGRLQEGAGAAVDAARRLTAEGGADLIKIDGAALFPETVRADADAGVAVWAQFGIAPHTAGGTTTHAVERPVALTDQLVQEATLLANAGASMLDFTNSGPVAGAAAVRAVSIPVIGGLGGGPWLDGRVRSLFAAIGYSAAALDDTAPRYANVAETARSAVRALCNDVRAGRQIRGD